MNYPSTHPSLLEKIRQGDEIAWSDFYDRYKGVIRAVGALYRFNEEEQNDLVQRVMAKFCPQSRRFVYRAGVVRFRTYFATIIRSEAVDYIRANAARRRAEERAAALSGIDEDSFARTFLEEWRRAAFAEALEELRGRVKFKTYQAFQLYGLQNRPVREVAELLEISEHQVHVAKSRCTGMLREIVARYDAADEELELHD